MCACARECVWRQEDAKENTAQKNHRGGALEKRTDLWFLTFYGVTDHSEGLMKAMDFSRKQNKTKQNKNKTHLTYPIFCPHGDSEAHLSPRCLLTDCSMCGWAGTLHHRRESFSAEAQAARLPWTLEGYSERILYRGVFLCKLEKVPLLG